MRLITVSVLSIFAIIPAFADARLPIVNVTAGSVSARAAFGEPIAQSTENRAQSTDTSVKNVVARNAKPAPLKNIKSELSNLKSTGDVLNPKRPSNDLWAKVDKPLRLPEPDEFSVIRADYELPEESLDSDFAAAAPKSTPAIVARATTGDAVSNSDLDAQLAKLVELQRRADESIRAAAAAQQQVAKVAPRPTTISSYDIGDSMTTRAAKLQPLADVSVRRDYGAAVAPKNDVAVRRVVIPMEHDAIVRPVNLIERAPAVAMDSDMSKMSPSELKKAFKKTYLSENKHLSTFQIDERFDVASDATTAIEGFSSERDLSESGGVRPLEIKIGFRGDDAALSRDNYNLLSEYASIIVSNPKRAIQVSIPERSTRNPDARKLAARRLAIVEQVLHDTGVSDARVMPVLSQRNDESFVLRVISSDQFETMTQQKRDMFGDTVGKKSYKSMTW